MKIAVVHFIANTVLGTGSAAKSIALSRALSRAGVHASLITTDVGAAEYGVPTLTGVDMTVVPSRFRRFPIPWIGRRALTRLVADCDAVILVSHWSMLNARVYRAAHLAGVPVILCPAGALTVQGRSRWLKHLYQAVFGRGMIAHAGAFIATTRLEAAQFQAEGIDAGRIHVIPNGIDPEPAGMSAEEFRTRYRVPAGPLALFVGRLNPIKGPDLLVDAFGRIAVEHPQWRLVLAGRDEGLEPELRGRVASLGLADRVHFVGHLDASGATGAYRAASLLVVPSRHEAMSLVALEAAVVGTPVLLTDACGFDEVRRIGGGDVVPATTDGLAAGLGRLLQDPTQLPALGANLRRFVVRQYGWPVVIEQYLALARRLRSDRARTAERRE